MPEPTAVRAFQQLAQKWRELAERRREHFAELYRSGRWRHYYTEEQFVAQMREVVRAAEEWARIAPSRVTAEPAE
jgi:uncharacterized repeat protein (TIGR03809 family)